MAEAPPSFAEISARLEWIIARNPAELAPQAQLYAAELLALGERILEAWLIAHGIQPTEAKSEGFRLLALHRQGAARDPTFNACRESCRELVYHYNLVRASSEPLQAGRWVRLGAMVALHLALFVGGKLEISGLGEFCCSSRPLRQNEVCSTITTATQAEARGGPADADRAGLQLAR
ncbi:MAG: hypothetical protein IRZ23_09070 [Acetobacteraceae bacterium]|nr:hypothetical protein [Acetobacteraceae bacterium]